MSVIGIAAFLAVLYLISYFMNWAHYEGDEAKINGFGWMTLEDSANGNSFASNIFALAGLLVIITLGWGVVKLLWSDSPEEGVRDILIAGGIAVAYALFAFMFKMAIGAFITDGKADQVEQCRKDAKSLGASSTVVRDLCGSYQTPFTDPQSGAGPVLCLLAGLVTLMLGAVLAVTAPQAREKLGSFGVTIPDAVPIVNLGGAFTSGDQLFAAATGSSSASEASGATMKVPAPDPRAVLGAVSEFWSWWGTMSGRVTGVVENDPTRAEGETMDTIALQISERVHAIHPRLEWSFGPGGDESRHRLTVSAAGIRTLQPTAARWYAAAPAADGTWSFRTLRPATIEPFICDGVSYDPAQMVYSSQNMRLGVELKIWDPRWKGSASAALGSLFRKPQGAQGSQGTPDSGQLRPSTVAAARLINRVLGEETAAGWVNEYKAVGSDPRDSRPARSLPNETGYYTGKYREAIASGGFADLNIPDPDKLPRVAHIRLPLASVIAPTCDVHVLIEAQPHGTDTVNAGFSPAEAAEKLFRSAESVVEKNGGKLVVYTTHQFRPEAHFYLDGASDSLDDVVNQIKSLAGSWKLGTAAVKVHSDAAWDQVGYFRWALGA
ncbi:hypothetical protein [Corynebacterium variabile]|uniref:hypothetical protein n=1 Tax=Corynebacterium variabile TaxID=1727 RepID=UPI003A8F2545